MGIEVKLPELSDGVETADVLDVLVAVGDDVGKDQAIIEIETDKATAEIPSPEAGKITQVHVKPGQTVTVGTILVTLDATVAAPPKVASAQPTKPITPTPALPIAESLPSSSAPTSPASQASTSHPTPPAAPSPTAMRQPPPVTSRSSSPPLAAGPAVRRFAREVGVDLSTVQGTGETGRITRDDVLEMVRRANRAVHSGEGAAISETDVPGDPSLDPWGPVSIESAPRIRRIIAKRMHESWSNVPRVTNFDDADVTDLEKIRQASKDDYEAKGLKLTSMPFLIKAVSMALRNHPVINAEYDMAEAKIIYKRYVSVGVAIDTPRGLVVPALRNTDQQSISEITHGLAAIVTKVRDGKFGVDDLRGSTFTISNLGAIGGTYSTPIVNLPELAILLVGRTRKLPVVIDDQIVARLMMPLSLSYDHRLVDGAAAARFLNDVISFLEEPGRLLLAP
jgi:pyruvate dehydrogenase E2 component (dihydrolipoamide acetyltransferase)